MTPLLTIINKKPPPSPRTDEGFIRGTTLFPEEMTKYLRVICKKCLLSHPTVRFAYLFRQLFLFCCNGQNPPALTASSALKLQGDRNRCGQETLQPQGFLL